MYSTMACFKSGCVVSMPLSMTATVIFVAFLNPVAARVTEANRSVPPLPRGERIDAGFLRRANSCRTGGTNAYSTSFMRATCAASWEALEPFPSLSSTRRGDRRRAPRSVLLTAANMEGARSRRPCPRRTRSRCLRRGRCRSGEPDPTCVTPARWAARPPWTSSRPASGWSPPRGGDFGDDRSLRLLRRLDLVLPQTVPVPVLRHNASQFAACYNTCVGNAVFSAWWNTVAN